MRCLRIDSALCCCFELITNLPVLIAIEEDLFDMRVIIPPDHILVMFVGDSQQLDAVLSGEPFRGVPGVELGLFVEIAKLLHSVLYIIMIDDGRVFT